MRKNGFLLYEVFFDIDGAIKEVKKLESLMQSEDFWSDPQRGAQVAQKLTWLKKRIGEWRDLMDEAEYLIALAELAGNESEETKRELSSEIEGILGKLDAFELSKMFTDDDDVRDAILAIHPGAGGTESQDWAQMLLRMYSRWAQEHHYDCRLLDLQAGDDAGIKSATLEVNGE